MSTSAALIGDSSQLGWTVVKALLLFAVAVVGLRLSERRVVAQLNVFDFVVTVAVGAIIGRTATSANDSFATGAVALITLLVAHRVVAELRRRAGSAERLIGVRWYFSHTGSCRPAPFGPPA